MHFNNNVKYIKNFFLNILDNKKTESGKINLIYIKKVDTNKIG